jgi:hypothetical protein
MSVNKGRVKGSEGARRAREKSIAQKKPTRVHARPHSSGNEPNVHTVSPGAYIRHGVHTLPTITARELQRSGLKAITEIVTSAGYVIVPPGHAVIVDGVRVTGESGESGRGGSGEVGVTTARVTPKAGASAGTSSDPPRVTSSDRGASREPSVPQPRAQGARYDQRRVDDILKRLATPKRATQ